MTSLAHTDIDFQALFDAAPGIYLVLDSNFNMVAANEARLKATMTTRDSVIGRNVFEAFPDNPDDPAADGVRNLRTSLERVLQTKASDAMAVQKYDIPRPQSQGGGFEARYWSPLNTPVFGPDGEVKYIIHRVEDVTDFMRLKQQEAHLQSHADRIENEIYQRAQEVQEANRRFEAANAELVRLYEKTKELDATKTRFFANISHELRTPLTLILGPLEKLLRGPELEEGQRQTLEMAARNGRLLLHHVNDLLDVAKLDAGKMSVVFVEADLAVLLRFMGGHFESLACDRDIAFSIDAPLSVLAETDADKVQRILLNLLSNAFKFTPSGGAIACFLRLDGDRAEISVEDSGPGVPAPLRALIFEPFRQGEEEATRRFGGTGLGLAIAKEFVDLLGGDISVAEAASGGARFSFWVPIAAPHGAVVSEGGWRASLDRDMQYALDVATARTRKLNAPTFSSSSERPLALVIEDNPEMNQFIGEVLSELCAVAHALDGRSGLEKAEQLRPDIILSDMMMPNMSGDQVVKALRARPEFNETPIILLTAKADQETRVSLLRGGVQDLLVKPFNAEELLARVGNLLEAKRGSEALKRNQRLSEQQRRDLMENARDALFVLDKEGRIMEANRRGQALLRRSGESLEGRKLSELADLDSETNSAGGLDQLLARSEFELDALALDVGDGVIVPVDLSGARVMAGGQEAMLVIARDATERVSLQNQLRQAQKLEAMGQLTGGIAHDFNNLLSAVTLNVEALQRRLPENGEARAITEQIGKVAGRGQAMTRRLLAFARQQPVVARECDLNELIAASLEMIERILPHDIRIEAHCAPDLDRVFIDPSQFEDALLNLVINARDAMQSGGHLTLATVNMELDGEANFLPRGRYVSVCVSDTGDGMSKETLQRVFEPFFTTKPEGKGTGLGLSMVYGFARQARGDVHIASVLGKGTSVSILLPRLQDSVQNESLARPTSS